MERQEVIALLRQAQGNQPAAALAKTIGCSAVYLSDIYQGKRDPGPKILKFLGLSRRRRVEMEYSRE